MCFSASASLTAGVVVGGVGLATLPMVRNPRERLLATLPLVFGVHQLIEGVVWTQLEETGQASIRTPAVEAWLLIAWVILPVWLPAAVWMLEPDRRRRAWMVGFGVVGALTGGFLLVASIATEATVAINQNHLEYQLPIHPGVLLATPYILATCGPLLLCSRRFVAAFGIVMFVSMGLTVLIAAKELSSVWCFFAALLSVMLFVHYATERLNAESHVLAQ